MEQRDLLPANDALNRVRQSGRWAFSILIPAIAAILLAVVLRAKLRGEAIPTFLIFVVAAGFGAVILFGTLSLVRALREHRESEERYRQMASNIQEIFWMIDAESKQALEVNEAYETITGRSRQSLMNNPSSYEEVIHPEDRPHVLGKLEERLRRGSSTKGSGSHSRMGRSAGSASTDFPFGMLPARFGALLEQPKTLRNRNMQRIKSPKI